MLIRREGDGAENELEAGSGELLASPSPSNGGVPTALTICWRHMMVNWGPDHTLEPAELLCSGPEGRLVGEVRQRQRVRIRICHLPPVRRCTDATEKYIRAEMQAN